MKSAMKSMPEGKTVAHSVVVETSPGLRRLAGLAVPVRALIAMTPR